MEKKTVRNYAIDCQKGILTLLMLLCHCIQFFGEESRPVQGFLVDYINLTTFSGFYFCFGYVNYKAYFSKDFTHAVKRMLKNAGKLLIAFYISEIAFYALFENKIFKIDLLGDVLLIRSYAGWSEFLISFAGILILGLLLFPVFKKMRLGIFALFGAISIAACFLPYEKQTVPQLALLIGSEKYITYPCVQYMVYFAFGVLLSRMEWVFHKFVLLGCGIASLPVIGFYILKRDLPGRFPPSWIYITGAFLFIYLYYLLCHWLTARKNMRIAGIVSAYLSEVGANSLFYLLISNLLIFAFAGSAFSFRSTLYATGFYIILLLIIPYLKKLIRHVKLQ
ncbi:MAG TPA: hypothetical protein DDY59_04330 [Lachnospiraceae bacterium]|nr:hypothetical protein [Lachnospiraceae bacterium]HCA70580.1 hypothetical protein [Lachnospiraceae bacterium]